MSTKVAEIEFVDEASGQRKRVSSAYGKSLLAIAAENDIAIEHTCGGAGACSTCHVLIIEGQGNIREASDSEWDQLEQAPGFGPESRLACQAVVLRPGVIRCVIPKWNRNVVKETRA